MTAVSVVLNRLGLERLRLGSLVPPVEFGQPQEYRHRWCRACDVTWHGLPQCWCCGRQTAGIQ